MKLSANQRKVIIENLSETDAWSFDGAERVLSQFSDDALSRQKEIADKTALAVVVANAAVTGLTHGKTAFRINPETGKWEKRVVSNTGRTTKNAVVPDESDMVGTHTADEEEEPMYDEEGNLIPPRSPEAAVIPGKKMSPTSPIVAETEEPVPDDEEEYPAVNHQRRPRTAEDWFRSAPPEVQQAVNLARQVEIREKDAIISQLLVNVDESDKLAHRDRLIRRTLDELHNDLAIMPRHEAPSESRNGSPATTNRRSPGMGASRRREEDSDVLVPQTINWQEVKAGGSPDSALQQAVINVRDTEEIDTDDWIRTAPAHVRQAVASAQAIETREKRKIINQLTANVSDDAVEARLRRSLEKRSLADLKDMLLMSPPKAKTPANYFGASAAPIGNRFSGINGGGGGDPSEDVLVPQKIDWKEEAARKG